MAVLTRVPRLRAGVFAVDSRGPPSLRDQLGKTDDESVTKSAVSAAIYLAVQRYSAVRPLDRIMPVIKLPVSNLESYRTTGSPGKPAITGLHC